MGLLFTLTARLMMKHRAQWLFCPRIARPITVAVSFDSDESIMSHTVKVGGIISRSHSLYYGYGGADKAPTQILEGDLIRSCIFFPRLTLRESAVILVTGR